MRLSYGSNRAEALLCRAVASGKGGRVGGVLLSTSAFRLSPSSRRAEALRVGGFTLIELLVVISIIAVLMGVAFPVIGGVIDRAKKVQAKNDESQIILAVNAFYTDYGKYPIDTTSHGTSDVLYGDPGGSYTNRELMDVLRAVNQTLNPRAVAFLQVNPAKDANNPKGGIATKDVSQYGWQIKNGSFVDPWGGEYLVSVDGNYDNIATLYVTYNDLPTTVSGGCIAWSFGKDSKKGKDGNGNYTGSDDVVSWQ